MVYSDFDIDLEAGLEGELLVEELAKGKKTVEVKRDFIVSRTGNLAVEVSFRDKPSGIRATKAEWWVWVLDGPLYNKEVIVFVSTDRMKRITDRIEQERGTVRGGDGNMSRLVLVPVEEILK